MALAVLLALFLRVLFSGSLLLQLSEHYCVVSQYGTQVWSHWHHTHGLSAK